MFILQDMDYYFSHFPVLETERLILRAKTATDAEDMKTYMADENLYKYDKAGKRAVAFFRTHS